MGFHFYLRYGLTALFMLVSATAQAQLPAAVEEALQRARIPAGAAAFLVVDAQDAKASPRLQHRSEAPMQAASVMKLFTTYAALDLLGPAYSWSTPVYIDGPVRDGTLDGNLYIQGQGDPQLVMERLWLLLRRVQSLGITRISGDIVLDNSAFWVPDQDPAAFDGEPLRPYNARPEALLINYKSIVMTFTPEPAGRLARVQYDPPLWGVQTQDSVPLASGACTDYRAGLKADFSDPLRIRFGGTLPASCGEKIWPIAYVDPASYAPRAVQGLWRSMGAGLDGSAVWGTVPAKLLEAKPLLEWRSPPLAEVVREINKYSNNVMAQQVFLTLGREGGSGTARAEQSRALLQKWWEARIGSEDAPLVDNGAGLSRSERVSARALGLLLQHAYRSPLMPELIASLPISGIDGTLTRSKARAAGSAHLKTGSILDVNAIAGYVDAASGKRYALVAVINHANAPVARPVLDALVDWAAQDQ
jgi:D-alanyl-D-alanine carboxypeptidase/D-alanyl-D-alanine-endopeptidase (penicillin-binding protein 4)